MMTLSIQTALMFGIIFSGLAYYASRKKDAMWLWPGTRINTERLKDVAGFNRAVALTWGIYSLCYWISAAIAFFNPHLSDLIITWAATLGLLILCVAFIVIWFVWRKPRA